jgi:cytochrome P450
MSFQHPPKPHPEAGQKALKALLKTRSLLPALQVLHEEMGDIFQISFPRFNPVVLAGPEAAHFALVEARHDLHWRNETDSVTNLLRHGLLVQDGERHVELRRLLTPPLHRRQLSAYLDGMVACTDWTADHWKNGQPIEMLGEMRRAALLILTETLFDLDLRNDLDYLTPAVLRILKYISPGPWLLLPKAPRPGFGWAIKRIDEYLYNAIKNRRENPTGKDDMLSLLVGQEKLSDGLRRDQLLTMLIAGHDTSTALLAWTLYLLGKHPWAQEQARSEVETVFGKDALHDQGLSDLTFLEQVIKETLRLYPPIHVGNRMVQKDLEFNGYMIPAGRRLMVSIYATHRDPRIWEDPERFDPTRFAQGSKPVPYSYIPFGGGPRNCIGSAYAIYEAKAVLARLLQRFRFVLKREDVTLHMGATLEPRPGVFMEVQALP